MKRILLLFVASFLLTSVWGQNKDVTLPILQTPTSDSYLAFTTGYDVNSWGDQDYCLFNSISVYNENGQIGKYSTEHGQYISFVFVGGTNQSNVGNGQGFWCESKQMAYYCNWNGNKLSAFAIKDDSLFLVDLETDAILGTFPLTSFPNTSYRPVSICIMVYSGRLATTAIHRIVVNSEGSVKIYESLPNPKEEDISGFVDLGLPSGILWAANNLGANSPEESGYYYAWGETTPNKTLYDVSTYTDPNVSNISGTEYDAAYLTSGGKWRMPTYDDFSEIINNCTWQYTQVNSINGYKVIGKNGNSIFLPFVGGKEDNINVGYSEYGYSGQGFYASGSAFPYDNNYNWYLYMDTDPRFGMYGYNKTRGQTIRPITNVAPSSFKSMKVNDSTEIDEIYDLQGHKKPELQKGFNIVRMSNSTTKKMVVK